MTKPNDGERTLAAVAPVAEDAGLSSAEAARRLAEFGPNSIAPVKESPVRIFLEEFWAPVPWMLEAAVLVQIVLGERLEAAIIGALLVFNAVLSFVQRGRAQAALELLKARLALTASVKRDGVWMLRPAAELAPGDTVKLSLGAVAPADLQLTSGSVLLDQSALTGESVPSEAAAGDRTFAGALVRRGEAVALVTATGASTYFGRTAELVQIARAESAEQRAVLGIVRNLAILNGVVLAAMAVYGRYVGMPLDHIVPLMLTGLLASVPVALPAMFTLATALAAQKLTLMGVLPTRLSAVHEAATMDVLCSDKTGTLTQNALRVVDVRPMPGRTREDVLALAAAASAEGGMDPVDAAIRAAAAGAGPNLGFAVTRFAPFDPATKTAEADVESANGSWRVVKGAIAAVSRQASGLSDAQAAIDELTSRGYRVLAVAAGPDNKAAIVGLIALSDPPRADSARLIAALKDLGVCTVMVTGDAPGTATQIARQVGLAGGSCPPGRIPDRMAPSDYAVFAGVFPEDKYRLVRAFQATGHTVGMCGDGANDAPALRQAQIGIAVSTATDIAKSAAGIVLTEPGLGGIVDAVNEGRATFQRILTYMLNALIRKIETVLFLAVGLLITGHAVMTPILMVLSLLANDFLTMSIATDRAHPSRAPDRWRIGRITAAAAAIGALKLMFLAAVLAAGAYRLHLDIGRLQTLAFVALIFGTQATLYSVRERGRIWDSVPGSWMLLSSAVDIALAAFIAVTGVLTPALPGAILGAMFAAAVLLALALDLWKLAAFRALKIA
jgi:H+-transporting ATPase